MKFTILSAVSVAIVSASPHGARGSIEGWAPGGPDDFRGPCPMMNTLANHAYLPHDGRNLTKENVVKGLVEGINFDPVLAGIMWEQAIIANPEPNATFFTLDQLNTHNLLEHDASISRTDAEFGNNHVFNQTVFDTVTPLWNKEILTATDFANAKVFRQVASRAANPNYTFLTRTEPFSIGEMAAPVLVFGDIAAGTVRRDLIVSFFENERLPTDLGWKPQESPVTLDQIMAVSKSISDAVVLFTNAGNQTEPEPH